MLYLDRVANAARVLMQDVTMSTDDAIDVAFGMVPAPMGLDDVEPDCTEIHAVRLKLHTYSRPQVAEVMVIAGGRRVV